MKQKIDELLTLCRQLMNSKWSTPLWLSLRVSRYLDATALTKQVMGIFYTDEEDDRRGFYYSEMKPLYARLAELKGCVLDAIGVDLPLEQVETVVNSFIEEVSGKQLSRQEIKSSQYSTRQLVVSNRLTYYSLSFFVSAKLAERLRQTDEYILMLHTYQMSEDCELNGIVGRVVSDYFYTYRNLRCATRNGGWRPKEVSLVRVHCPLTPQRKTLLP